MPLLIQILLLGILAGCTSSPYGNFIESQLPAINQTLANDTVKQLVHSYPPARTRLRMGNSTADGYGQVLVAALRTKGYTLDEYAAQRDVIASPVATDTSEQASPLTVSLALRYVVDRPSQRNLYRVTLLVGEHTLSRAYIAQNNTVYPASNWVRRE